MPYDIWKVQDGPQDQCVDGPYHDKTMAEAIAKELIRQTGKQHVAVEHGSEYEQVLKTTNPETY